MTEQLDVFVRRPELDKYKDAAIAKAERGECEGGCEGHRGETRCVRAVDKEHGNDWGWFSYCEEAIEEDTRRGLALIDA